MSKMRGWEFLKGILEQRIHTDWVDPINKDDSKLLYDYKLAFARAKAASEILELIDQAKEDAKQLGKKARGEVVDKFRI